MKIPCANFYTYVCLASKKVGAGTCLRVSPVISPLRLVYLILSYPIIYFDLRNTKESVTGDPKKLEFYYRLNEAANAQDHTIFAVVLNEEEFVLKQIGNEPVAV